MSLISYSDLSVGVVGFGSIGKRHIENLTNLGIKNITLLRNKNFNSNTKFLETNNIEEFAQRAYDFILISNPTALHYKYLFEFINKSYNILCEKPVVSNLEEANTLSRLLSDYKGISGTAFNMRFHPVILKLREVLQDNSLGKVRHSRLFVGQYLPDWRPNSNYSETYSAIRELGGGVTLDLVHEIDLALFLFGSPVKGFESISGKYSDLIINTEDVTEIIYNSSRGSLISIHLDYLYRGYKRTIEIICDSGNIFCDLYKNDITLLDEKGNVINVIKFENFNRNDMYLDLMKNFLDSIIFKKSFTPNLNEGLESNIIALNVLKNNGLII